MITSLGHLDRSAVPRLTADSSVHFTFTHDRAYQGLAEPITLQIISYLDAGKQYVAITDTPLTITEIADDSPDNFKKSAAKAGCRTICLSEPLPLSPVHIPKPWGQEIWFSGIEKRGVSEVNGIPIAWLIDAFGEQLGCVGDPLLLKILDPFPTENLGDLYFEMHEQKIEVYVVTDVNQTAWKSDAGAIRYGFSQARLAEYETREDFLQAYVTAVDIYERCRRKIDEKIEAGKQNAGINPESTLTPDQYYVLLKEVPESLREEEAQLRADMYAFTDLRPLKVGDVVTVRPHVPHSLQHGVRVIEFQTPHYERYILSFGQKVITQDHWDTKAVFGKAITDPVAFDEPVALEDGVRLIADFEAFKTLQITLPPHTEKTLMPETYCMIIGIEGEALLLPSEQKLASEKAYLVGHGSPLTIKNDTQTQTSFLVATEKRQA